MLEVILRNGRRPIIAFAVLVALVLTNLGIAVSHHPLGDPTAIHHGDIFAHADHDHDDDDAGDDNGKEDSSTKTQKSALGHNAVDHSHVTAGAPPAGMSLSHTNARDWHAKAAPFADPKPLSNLDRPPKPAVFA
ncbi:hypothetical protein [Ferrovibrio sp.]|uniref:hypothetical protein n=1 Tax=Ferrovibrio sp. TaxID=1917215 RepID=UPI0035183A70